MAVHAAAYVSLGTMLTPIAESTGWSRTQIVAVAPLTAVLAPLLAPLVGTNIDRYGARPVAFTGFVIASAAIASLGLLQSSIVGWWLLWVIVAGATFPTGALVWTHLVTHSFKVRRGLALGLVLSGMGLATTIIPLFLALTVDSLGWRGAYAALGLLVLVIGVTGTHLACREPRKEKAETQETNQELGLTLGEAIRHWQFWQLGLILLLASGVIGCVIIHLQPMLIDKGATMVSAAALAAAFGPAQIAGRLGGGYLLDHVHGGFLCAVVFAIPIAGCVILIGSQATAPLIWIVPILFGIAAGLEIDAGAYLAGRYFGVRHFASVFAALFVFHIFGYTLAPLAAAYVRDEFGSYFPVLFAMVAALPAVAVLSATLGKYPEFSSVGLRDHRGQSSNNVAE
jgi:MFS family permease